MTPFGIGRDQNDGEEQQPGAPDAGRRTRAPPVSGEPARRSRPP